MKGKDISFLFARLKKSDGREVFYRLREHFLLTVLKKQAHFSLRIPAIDEDRIRALRLPDLQGEINEDTIDWILNGGRFSLGTALEEIEAFERTWQGRFSQDVRTGRTCKDIRPVWEPARLQHVTILLYALQRSIGSDEEVATFARRELLGWITKNPFQTGPPLSLRHGVRPAYSGLCPSTSDLEEFNGE